jgi:hypothetical protein
MVLTVLLPDLGSAQAHVICTCSEPHHTRLLSEMGTHNRVGREVKYRHFTLFVLPRGLRVEGEKLCPETYKYA